MATPLRCSRALAYRSVEDEEDLDQLVVRGEGVTRHKVEEPSESPPSPLDELPLRDRSQDCGWERIRISISINSGT